MKSLTSKTGNPVRDQGFALVVTLSLMILLTVIAVGLLSLSSIALRGSTQASAMAEARANARLALMLAIGELQKHSGPDTRSTAPADILDPSNPPLTGVWKSWQGSDHDTKGRPVTPDYGVKRTPEAAGGRFLSWLVSGAESGKTPSELVRKTPTGSTVALVSGSSLATGDDRQVHVVPVAIAKQGAMAWWVSAENQKARLPVPYQPVNPSSVAEWADISSGHTVADPKPFGLENLLADPAPAEKAITLHTANLLTSDASVKPRESFHDLSVSSVGLLTNTATGGWRKDLSLVTENWDNLPPTNLPFFRITPIDTTSITSLVGKSTNTNSQATQSLFYPWSFYRSDTTKQPSSQFGASGSWHHLKEHAIAYKQITAASGSYSIPYRAPVATFFPNPPPSPQQNSFDYLHKLRTSPVVARVHFLFSHKTTLHTDPVPTDATQRTYKLELLMTPVVTMWNPYNVTVTVTGDYRLHNHRTPPIALQHYKADGIATTGYRRLTPGLNSGQVEVPGNYPVIPDSPGNYMYRLATPFVLLPGETRVFSPTSLTPKIGWSTMNLSPGYRRNTGHLMRLSDVGVLNASSKVKVDLRFDSKFPNDENVSSVGFALDGRTLISGKDLYTQVVRLHYRPDVTQLYWPPIPSAELAQPEAQAFNNWQPFTSMVFGGRISGPGSTGLPGKGVLQANPMMTEVWTRIEAEAIGNDHPANASFDFSFFKHTGLGDDRQPDANIANNRGFIISGFNSSEGLSRVVLSNFPLRPLASLAELQNWDLRQYNKFPPFQLNVIANSDATPLLPADRVTNDSGHNTKQHDDSYCANHLLFDDWIFSSITPEPSNFGSAIAEDLQTRYEKFLKGERPLVNRAYRRISEDQNLDDALVTKRIDDALSPDGWQRVASRLEVDGMFNVNSTSKKAWRALLGHARDQKIPYQTENNIGLSGKTDHAFSRFMVAGDVQAGAPGSISGAFPESSEITGYRVFNDALLDILAKQIVEQIRLRGPFLSLSEFVNRQLGNDKNLALAGAIQTALNRMSEQAGAGDPYATLKSAVLSQDAGNPADPKLAGAGYVFPAAAVGKSTHGLPGWTRQADILRPLAPILSARDDTFTIRAYGEARGSNGLPTARAWCEATVRRTRGYVDPADAADLSTTPTRAANKTFGRKYEIISFRWLAPAEV